MQPDIQWYPGHIAKVERELQSTLKLIDCVIELVDARIPVASWNERLSTMLRSQRPALLVMNKADLADPQITSRWKSHFETLFPAVRTFDSVSGKNKATIIESVLKLGEPVFQKLEAKGLRRRPLRVCVVGMPNVGKSTLINTLVGKSKTKTGHRAGVTRTTQWVRIHPLVELLDTPGLIPPRLDSPEVGKLLASVYSVGDNAFEEEEILPFFIEQVEQMYPGRICEMLDLPPDSPVNIETIAQRRGALLAGGKLDLKRTAQSVLKDYRHGKLGKLSLERPD